eukprot:TRINITY_DN14782_c0_g1_i1.p1 TRINITY_DN14782_c0_g1~~TRINITY_DN14782_c0_g1_i1.p1  ORF type:complete len:447 (+),score=77.52 TRINITY_DN14782_c0_g1_i1:67-1407(+)
MGSCGSTPGSGKGPRPRAAAGKAASAAQLMLPGLQREYVIHEAIGRGAFGVVHRCTHRASGDVRAVKMLEKKSTVAIMQVESEKMVGAFPPHPNLIAQHTFFEDARVFAPVYEYCSGGEVLYNLQGRKVYTESTAAIVLKGLLRGLEHMHSRCVAHLDIKPQNMVFARKPDPQRPITVADLRVIDFGSATRFDRTKPSLNAVAGTPYFAAPEILHRVCQLGGIEGLDDSRASRESRPQEAELYDERCDVFSAAVIGFILLFGCHPFSPSDKAGKEPMAEFFDRVLAGDGHRPADYTCASLPARMMLERGLANDFRDRCSAADMLRSEWLSAVGEHDAPAATTRERRVLSLGGFGELLSQGSSERHDLRWLHMTGRIRDICQHPDAKLRATWSHPALSRQMWDARDQQTGADPPVRRSQSMLLRRSTHEPADTASEESCDSEAVRLT